MGHTVKDIAAALKAEAFGAVSLEVTGAAEPAAAGPEHLALAMDAKYAGGLAQGQARAALLWDGADWQALGLEAAIYAPRPRLAMAGLTALMDAGPGISPGVHPSAVIDESAVIGAGAAIGPLAVIGAGVTLGANARIASHVSIGAGSVIGADALLHAGVRIGANVRIGDRFIAQPGAVIGGDGFSFVTPETSRVEEARASLGAEASAKNSAWQRIHSLGGVEIGDDVEIGSNSAVDAGTIRATRIGRGTKIDNLVQIGHNVQVGEDVLICGQTGIAGSTTIGDRTVLAGQTGVGDNLSVGADVITGAGTMILARVPDGRVMLGYPAMKMDQYIGASKNWRRLPRLMQDVAALKKAVPLRGEDD
ncbi:MAG: UDP-3-O-(3-hydroxymyristoyl)glucosamine N-acyltransferase [Silicimonas sp.]|nr:UDP-3-O-(3-hydroxymyristoyl)glucosamine N-acyltransferase [Silicimonas sp.]